MLALCLWSLFEAICWVRAPGRFPGGGPVTQAGQPRKQHRPGDRYTRPAGWRSIKALQPARSLYMLQGPLICKRCCLPSGPWGAATVFVPLLRDCFQCSLCAIYVNLCRMAGWSQSPWQNAHDPFGEVFFSFKGSFSCLRNHLEVFFFILSLSLN